MATRREPKEITTAKIGRTGAIGAALIIAAVTFIGFFIHKEQSQTIKIKGNNSIGQVQNSSNVSVQGQTYNMNGGYNQIGNSNILNLNLIEEPKNTNQATIEQQIAFYSKSAAARSWEPPELPRSAFQLGSPQVAVKFGGTIQQFEVGPKDHPFPPEILLPGGPVFTLYIENNRVYVEAETPFGDSSKTVLMNNEWPTNLPDKWQRNFNENSFEIVDNSGLPVFQVRYDAPNQLEIYGIFVASNGAITVAFGDSVMGGQPGNPVPTIPERKAWFKYPSEQHLGELADP